VIPGCVPFSSAIADYPRTPVSLAELTNWKTTPDPLLGSYFIASGDHAEDDEIFQVISFSTIFGGKKVFYLQFADEDEAVGFQVDHFFKLLEKAARIMSH
jgi:hypothetical protein